MPQHLLGPTVKLFLLVPLYIVQVRLLWIQPLVNLSVGAMCKKKLESLREIAPRHLSTAEIFRRLYILPVDRCLELLEMNSVPCILEELEEG